MADQAPVAVVLTPIRVEWDAVREHLLDFRELDRVKGTIFHGGRLARGPWQVVLARPGPGNNPAAALTERAIRHFQPDLVMLVGIAGRLHTDLSLGDIVFGTKIYPVHSGVEKDDGFRPRPDTWKPPHGLRQEVEQFDAKGSWRNALRDQSRSAVTKVEFRPIAAAEVVLDAEYSELRQRIRRSYSDAAVIEMEGAGVGEACRLNKVPMMNIRAVSDHADGSKEKTDQTGAQQLAAQNAAAFAMALLAELRPPSRAAPQRRPARHVLVSGSTPAVLSPTDLSGWAADGQVMIGDREYLIVEDTLAERPLAGGVARQRESRGIQVSPAPRPGSEHVWVRRIEPVADGVSVKSELAMLATERDLLTGLRSVRGFPDLVQFAGDERSSTLVTGWPVSRATRLPCETLDLIAAPGLRLDEWRTAKLFKGLAGLCETLAVLHNCGRAHRYLSPAGLIRLDNDTLVLRDLGLAGRGFVPGEGPPGYQAPEQRRRTRHRPGPPIDVFQLAALVYHVLTGQLPATNNPLPLRHYRGDIPEPVGRSLDAALSADPSARPGPRVLGAAFGRSLAGPQEEPSCVS